MTRRMKLILGAGAAALALGVAAVLVITLVVVPQQRADEAAALAAEKAAQEAADLDEATSAFQAALDSCEQAADDYSAARSAAQESSSIDAALLTDGELLTALATELELEALECPVPAMATETEEIRSQTSAIEDASAEIADATSRLSAAARSVDDSAAEHQRQAAQLTGTDSDSDGYSFALQLELPDPQWDPFEVTINIASAKPGEAYVEKNITEGSIPLTVTNTTSGREARYWYSVQNPDLIPIWRASSPFCQLDSAVQLKHARTPSCTFSDAECNGPNGGTALPLGVSETATVDLSCEGRLLLTVPEGDAESVAAALSEPPAGWVLLMDSNVGSNSDSYFGDRDRCELVYDETVPTFCGA